MSKDILMLSMPIINSELTDDTVEIKIAEKEHEEPHEELIVPHVVNGLRSPGPTDVGGIEIVEAKGDTIDNSTNTTTHCEEQSSDSDHRPLASTDGVLNLSHFERLVKRKKDAILERLSRISREDDSAVKCFVNWLKQEAGEIGRESIDSGNVSEQVSRASTAPPSHVSESCGSGDTPPIITINSTDNDHDKIDSSGKQQMDTIQARARAAYENGQGMVKVEPLEQSTDDVHQCHDATGNHVPPRTPPNAFMLFAARDQRKKVPTTTTTTKFKVADKDMMMNARPGGGEAWRPLPNVIKERYEEVERRAAIEHNKMRYPGWLVSLVF